MKPTNTIYQPKTNTGEKNGQNITNAFTTCDMLTVITGLIVNDNNSAERTAAEFFNENFNTYVNIKFSKLEDNWKTYIRLTVAGRRIRLRPRTKFNIRALVQ